MFKFLLIFLMTVVGLTTSNANPLSSKPEISFGTPTIAELSLDGRDFVITTNYEESETFCETRVTSHKQLTNNEKEAFLEYHTNVCVTHVPVYLKNPPDDIYTLI